MAAHNFAEKLPSPQSALFTESFAYITIKDRLPVILSKVADTVHRKKNDLGPIHGEQNGAEDLKNIAGNISKLRYEMQTDKPVSLIEDRRSDAAVWNQVLESLTKQNNKPPTWYSAAWLYLECYMYRRLQQSIEFCKVLKGLDVFEEQKKNAFEASVMAIQTLLTYLSTTIDNQETDTNKHSQLFHQFMQVALWGNRCDLSISASMENSQTSCILEQLYSLESNILLNDNKKLWNHLQYMLAKQEVKGRIDIVLDNAGFELITDLCLAEFLLCANITTTVHFHGKDMPWFVSDVTSNDFYWTLQRMAATNNMAMSRFGCKWQDRIEDGSWVLHFDEFWTTPYSFAKMKSEAPTLYRELAKADLLIFKGDLNYRKLVGDLQWETTVLFEKSLQGFHPAPLVTLRALKSDVVVGLNKGQDEEIAAKDKFWMVNGNWSVICFSDKVIK